MPVWLWLFIAAWSRCSQSFEVKWSERKHLGFFVVPIPLIASRSPRSALWLLSYSWSCSGDFDPSLSFAAIGPDCWKISHDALSTSSLLSSPSLSVHHWISLPLCLLSPLDVQLCPPCRYQPLQCPLFYYVRFVSALLISLNFSITITGWDWWLSSPSLLLLEVFTSWKGFFFLLPVVAKKLLKVNCWFSFHRILS